MRILLCIDDIGDLTKETSTGKIANYIVKNIMYSGYGKCELITMHQLLIHKDIPYTSHNSSMCIRADVNEDDYMEIIKESEEIIKENMTKSSNPGICVIMEEKLINKDEIIAYGLKAKKEVITKKEAYDLAGKSGIYLKEHGGTGQGVIGALAGAALRLSGNDGEYKQGIELENNNKIIIK
ncbi:MAG: hypothetical protein RR645_05410 [Clostridium sp.]